MRAYITKCLVYQGFRVIRPTYVELKKLFERECSEVRWEDVSTEVGLCLEARKSVK